MTEGRNDGSRCVEWMGVAVIGHQFRDGSSASYHMMPFERVKAWHDAHAFALSVSAEADGWPKYEMFALTAQVRRAAVSIPTNIAEGAGKRGSKEYRKYLDIALGSFSELTYLLIFARDRGYLARESWKALELSRQALGRRLWRLYASVARHAHSN